MVSEQDVQPGQARDLAAELRLRPEQPPVTRLSRKVLLGLGTMAAVGIGGSRSCLRATMPSFIRQHGLTGRVPLLV